jgi:hypothetical protein
MSVYFELNDNYAREYLPADVKYVVDHSVRNWYAAMASYAGDGETRKLRECTMGSDRIWQEDSNGAVRYTKNRFADNWSTALVDMNEFFWIKLKCHKL